MKKITLFSAMFILLFSLHSKSLLTVYCYDSLQWISEKIIPEFEKQNNCKVKVVLFESTGAMLSRLILERKRPKADVVIGLNKTHIIQSLEYNLFLKYKPDNYDKITNDNLIIDNEFRAVSYDYGSIAVIYNPDLIKNIPKSFNDILKMHKSLIIQDPRTSSTGMDFLLWTIAIYKEEWQNFWKELKKSIKVITPGWSESFSKFEAEEAPMMISYATDGAYSYHYYKSTKYKTFIPDEGGFLQVEGAAILQKSKNKGTAKKFIDFILSDKFQKEIPLNQWMFPVINVELPEAFKYAVNPKKIVSIESEEISTNVEQWLKEWEDIFYNN